MPSTTHYRRGDVVLVPFPFTDLTAVKQRPALVVSSDSFNLRDDVIVMAITSQLPESLTAEEIGIPQNELAACGLPKPSIVKLGKIVTLHHQLIVKRIGGLPSASLAKVLDQFRQMF